MPESSKNDMARHRQRDPIPDEFASIQEPGNFWDTHDLTDYEDQAREVNFEVDLRRHVFLIGLDWERAKNGASFVHRQGISPRSTWLTSGWAKGGYEWRMRGLPR